jgi:thiol-disulfide isomerase/thioredoxin
MATRKRSVNRKVKPSKTIRRHRFSTAGKIKLPLDVRSDNDLRLFRKVLKDKGLTIILVYATWCPHCHTIMPHFDEAASKPGNTVSAVKIQEPMLRKFNEYVKNNVNNSARPIQVNGYPSIILVNKHMEQLADIAPVNSTESLEAVMKSAGPLAEQANLTNGSINKKSNSLNVTENIFKTNSVKANSVKANSIKTNSVKANSVKANSVKANSVKANSVKTNSNESIKTSIAPSPLNMFPGSPTNKPLSLSKKEESIAEEITSMEAPISTEESSISTIEPPIISDDIESADIEPANKLSGGGRKGGSLMSAMARATYTLAPTAALLATAAMVIKRRKGKSVRFHKTPKHLKKYKKTARRHRK